jgi:hypothetical protein
MPCCSLRSLFMCLCVCMCVDVGVYRCLGVCVGSKGPNTDRIADGAFVSSYICVHIHTHALSLSLSQSQSQSSSLSLSLSSFLPSFLPSTVEIAENEVSDKEKCAYDVLLSPLVLACSLSLSELSFALLNSPRCRIPVTCCCGVSAVEYELTAGAKWEQFYQHNESRFFKERNYLQMEYPVWSTLQLLKSQTHSC